MTKADVEAKIDLAQKAVDEARAAASTLCLEYNASEKRKQKITQMFADARISLTVGAERVRDMPNRN